MNSFSYLVFLRLAYRHLLQGMEFQEKLVSDRQGLKTFSNQVVMVLLFYLCRWFRPFSLDFKNIIERRDSSLTGKGIRVRLAKLVDHGPGGNEPVPGKHAAPVFLYCLSFFVVTARKNNSSRLYSLKGRIPLK